MAQHLTAKAAAETRAYEWAPALRDGDSIASYGFTPATVTISDDENEGDRISFKVADGVAGTVYTIDATAESSEGEYFAETLYLPVAGEGNAFTYTVRDVCDFAMRKIAGNGNSPEAAELADAQERLSDMLAAWASQGAQTGVPLPLAAGDTLFVSDAFVAAIKFNLRVSCHDHYDAPLTPFDVNEARRGLQLVKSKNLPAERAANDYF